MNNNIKTFIATNVFVELFKQVGDRSKTYFYHTYFMSTWNHNCLANQVYLKVFENTITLN